MIDLVQRLMNLLMSLGRGLVDVVAGLCSACCNLDPGFL